MTLALGALAAEVQREDGSLAKVVDVVEGVYGAQGSFVCDYAGAERERAVGALGACAAVVAAAEGGEAALGGKEGKVILGMMRAVAEGNGGKWGLGAAVVRVVRDVLRCVGKDGFQEHMAKPVLKWCRERRECVDGVGIALVVYVEMGFVATPGFVGVYDKPDAFEKALLASFTTGFPVWGDGEAEVPVQWRLALQIAGMQGAGAKAVCKGGVVGFWKDVVVKMLVKEAGSTDKRTLAVLMLPIAVEACSSLEDFQEVLADDVAAMLRTSPRGALSGAPRRRRKNNESGNPGLKRWQTAAAGLGEALLGAIREKQKAGLKEAGVWAAELVAWAMKKRLAVKMFNSASLRVLFSLLSEADADKLFRSVVGTIARPECNARDLSVLRSDGAHLLTAFCTVQSERTVDVMKVLSLYSVFNCLEEGGESAPNVGDKRKGKKDNLSIKAMGRHMSPAEISGNVLPLDFGGLVPAASPPISTASAAMMFRKVTELVSSSRSSQPEQYSPLLDKCLAFIDGLEAEAAARRIEVRSARLDLMPAVGAVLSDVSGLPDAVSALPVSKSIVVLTQFMKLYIYDPVLVEDEDLNSSVSAKAYGRILKLLGAAVKTLAADVVTTKKDRPSAKAKAKAGSGSDSDAMEDEEEVEASALEQLVFILVTVCRQHSATLRHIAKSAFEVIADVADTSVSAVIFDLLEGGADAGDSSEKEDAGDVSDEGEEDEEDESDEDEEDESEGESGDAAAEFKNADAESESEKGSGDDSDDSDASVEGLEDIMLDDEDPEVLEKYDAHLSNHMKLVKVEKKKNKRARQQTKRDTSSTARILDMVELLARRMRLRVETDDSTGDTLFAFLDLIVRIVEFGYARDLDGVAHIDRLVAIFKKHLDRPLTSFSGGSSSRVSEKEANELLARYFEALTEANGRRQSTSSEQGMIAHSCSILCRVLIAKTGANAQVYALVEQGYRDMWMQYQSGKNRLLGSNVFVSAAGRIPELLPTLVSLAVDTAKDGKTSSSGTRSNALQVLMAYVPALRSAADSSPTFETNMWTGVMDIVSRGAEDTDGAIAMWKHGVGIQDLLRLVEAGLSGGEIAKAGVGERVQKLLSRLLVPRSTKVKFTKSLKAIYVLSSPPAEDAQPKTAGGGKDSDEDNVKVGKGAQTDSPKKRAGSSKAVKSAKKKSKKSPAKAKAVQAAS